MKPRIMYIESKAGGLNGPGRMGRVQFSKTGKTLHYDGKAFQSLKGFGYKSNYFDVDTGDRFWISGCKKRDGDRLYPGLIQIDDDVREEYWSAIRQEPARHEESVIRCNGKY